MEYVTPGPVEENWSEAISPVEEIINEARNGRMFILVDHEDRENEGDLVIPAQMATPDAINFMATNGRGLICLTLPGERVDALGLSLVHTNKTLAKLRERQLATWSDGKLSVPNLARLEELALIENPELPTRPLM